MLASLKFVEKYISLLKIKTQTVLNNKHTEIETYNLEKITSLLTRQGFEVDSIRIHGNNLESVVVGHIEKIEPHPNSSKLQICYVNVGESAPKQIVCGAQNARAGLYVAVALIGTKLPIDLEIKPSKIRDIDSFGMLCAREELGLPVNKELDGDGIWELHQECQGGVSIQKLAQNIGNSVFATLNLTDVILELSITPNRPDMLSHVGVARELAAAFAYEGISFEQKEIYTNKTKISEEHIKQDVKNYHSVECGNILFTAENHLETPAFFMALDAIKVAPSPAWLRNLLEALGQSSINNIVDISNYILLAHGQPSHAFDLEKITSANPNNKKLILRKAKPNEKFVGLDGKDRELHETDEVICDLKGTQGLLGVLGGEHSKVTNSTQKIIVEFANPHPVSVRHSSRRHSRQTDASFMFEKGIDAAARFHAAAEFYALLCETQSQAPIYCGSVHSLNNQNQPQVKIDFPQSKINFAESAQQRILGAHIIDYKEQLHILKSLGFGILNATQNSATIVVPSWRSMDVCGEADLVEEFIRVVGIDKVPSTPIIAPAVVNHDDSHFKIIEKLCSRTAALGYNEVISLHFMRANDFEKLGLHSADALGTPITLLNPIIGDEPLLHTSLVPDLLRKVNRNLAYGNFSGQLFHSCRTFQNADVNGSLVFNNLNATQTAQPYNKLQDYHFSQGFTYTQEKSQAGRPVETPRLAGTLFGNKVEKTWQNKQEIPWSLHDMMCHVTEICKSINLEIIIKKISSTENDINSCFHPFASALHPGRRVGFYLKADNNSDIAIGWAGELHPQTMRAYEIETVCLAFELNTALLIQYAQKPTSIAKRATITQKFPTIKRDFAFVLENSVTAKELSTVVSNSLSGLIEKEIPAHLQSVNIFDIYKGKGIPENKQSVAFQVFLVPLEKTFTDKEIQKISLTIINAIQQQLNGELRG